MGSLLLQLYVRERVRSLKGLGSELLSIVDLLAAESVPVPDTVAGSSITLAYAQGAD